LKLIIYDVLGRIVFSQKLQGSRGANKFSVSLSNLPEGIYFVQLNAKDLKKGKKFIKEK